MQCDWYAATIKDTEINVLSVLEREYGSSHKTISGKNGYEEGIQFLNNFGDAEVTVFAFGNKGASPHVFASSDRAIRFRDLCRKEWANSHEVTRIDVCEDFDGGFLTMKDQLTELATQKGLYLDQRGDWTRPNTKQGKTLYIGSPTSPVRCRLYEKGKQLSEALFTSKGLIHPEGFPIDMVRLEAQVRPVKHQRKNAAVCELSDIWGYSLWLKEAAAKILMLDVPRCSADSFRNADADRSLQFMMKQYHKVLSSKAQELGSWEELGLLLKQMNLDQKAAAKARSAAKSFKDLGE